MAVDACSTVEFIQISNRCISWVKALLSCPLHILKFIILSSKGTASETTRSSTRPPTPSRWTAGSTSWLSASAHLTVTTPAVLANGRAALARTLCTSPLCISPWLAWRPSALATSPPPRTGRRSSLWPWWWWDVSMRYAVDFCFNCAVVAACWLFSGSHLVSVVVVLVHFGEWKGTAGHFHLVDITLLPCNVFYTDRKSTERECWSFYDILTFGVLCESVSTCWFLPY